MPASSAYVEEREAAMERLAALTEHLNTNEARDPDGTRDWGNVGDMAHMNVHLRILTNFLGLEHE